MVTFQNILLSPLGQFYQVNIFNVYVVETIVDTINAGENRFSKSRVHVQE